MSNKIAVLPGVGKPFEVITTEIHTPQNGEVLVKVTYAASNYMDPFIQKMGFPTIKSYPVALGCDFAGIVEAVGEGVTKFKKGDRVHGLSPDFPDFDLRNGSFQQYTISKEDYMGHIPKNVSEELAVTFCAPIMTAYEALYVDLKLQLPSLEKNPPRNGKTIYINGAGSGVGAAAVLLANLSGYRVIATSSPHNFDFIKKLGADQVFDYKDSQLFEKVKQSLNGQALEYSVDCFYGPNTLQTSIDLIDGPGTVITAFAILPHIKADFKQTKHIFMYLLRLFDDKEVLKKYYEFIYSGLEQNLLTTIKGEVIGHGVEEAQKLLDFHGSGNLSASKPILKL